MQAAETQTRRTMASKAWSLSRVFVKALTASTRGVWRGGAGLPPAPQLALAGVQQQQQPANSQSLGQALNDLLGALWLAVPKKRTTPARRNQRRWVIDLACINKGHAMWGCTVYVCCSVGATERATKYPFFESITRRRTGHCSHPTHVTNVQNE